MSFVFCVKNMAFRLLSGSFPPGTGRLGVPPLRAGTFFSQRATARVAPTPICLNPDGRVTDPPLRRIQKPSVFNVGAGPRPARRCTRRSSRRPRPTAQHQPPPARQSQARLWNRTNCNSGKVRAQCPGRNHGKPLRFCALEIKNNLSGGRPP